MFNHFTCIVTGCFFNGSTPFHESTFHEPWFKYALLMGVMFISIFNIVGFTTQKIGVAVASVANKLSLVIPFCFSVYLYSEKISALKIIGIVVALMSIVLTCLPARSNNQEAKASKIKPLLLILVPAVLFFSSGLLDTLIKYVEQGFLNNKNSYNQYMITAFASAGIIGSIVLAFLLLTGKQKFSYKSIIAGVCIGFPNYFSIWCLVKVLKSNAGNSSAIIPINNMGIVLFSSVTAWLIFKERLSAINWIGIILSLGAIALIAYG